MSEEIRRENSEKFPELREKIDRVDEELMRLLGERLRVVQAIGKWKEQNGVNIIDASREQQVREHWQQWAAQQGLPQELVEPIIVAIISSSRSIQQK